MREVENTKDEALQSIYGYEEEIGAIRSQHKITRISPPNLNSGRYRGEDQRHCGRPTPVERAPEDLYLDLPAGAVARNCGPPEA